MYRYPRVAGRADSVPQRKPTHNSRCAPPTWAHKLYCGLENESRPGLLTEKWCTSLPTNTSTWQITNTIFTIVNISNEQLLTSPSCVTWPRAMVSADGVSPLALCSSTSLSKERKLCLIQALQTIIADLPTTLEILPTHLQRRELLQRSHSHLQGQPPVGFACSSIPARPK